MLVEMTSNEVYRASPIVNPELSHLLHGIRMKRYRGGYVPAKGAKETLISRAHILRKLAD